jgi:hypothetical protein
MIKKQKTYFTISLTLAATGILLSVFYRPYIYENQLNDFGFADTIGSLISVIAFCFLFWSFNLYSKAQMNIHITMATIVYAFIWEFAGLLGIYGTFDWKDIVAGLISGTVTYFAKEWIEKHYKGEDKIIKT